MKEKCLKCKDVLFQKGLLDKNGHMGMDLKTQLDLQSDGDDKVFICPYCSAKNVISETKSKGGLSKFRISHIKE